MNKMKLSRRISVVLSILLIVLIFPISASAEVGTAFTYQGQLYVSGAPASSAYDFKFSLYDSESGGTAKGTLNKSLTVTNGYFCTSLDFGSSIYDGTAYWLEIEVGEAGSGTYTMLGNRQALNPSPYAIFAASVADGAVTPAKINADGSSNGQTLISDGTNVTWGNVAPGTIGADGSSNGQTLISDGTNVAWGNVAPGTIGADGSSNGQTLISDGTNVAWGNVAPGTIGADGSSNGQTLISDGTNVAWGNVAPGTIGADGSSNGQTLISDGTNVAWGNVAPGTIGTNGASNGQVLTFDGSKTGWGNVAPGAINANGSSKGQTLISDGTNVEWGDISTGASPKLYYMNNPNQISLYSPPPLNTEQTVASVNNAALESGQDVKIDYSLNLIPMVSANWYIKCEIRLYRDGTLIKTDRIDRWGNVAGTYNDPLSGTFVDIVTSTGNHTYEVRTFFETAANTTMVSASQRCLNIIAF